MNQWMYQWIQYLYRTALSRNCTDLLDTQVTIVRVNDAERQSQRRGSIFDLSAYGNGDETVQPRSSVSARKARLTAVLVNKR